MWAGSCHYQNNYNKLINHLNIYCNAQGFVYSSRVPFHKKQLVIFQMTIKQMMIAFFKEKYVTLGLLTYHIFTFNDVFGMLRLNLFCAFVNLNPEEWR